MKKVYILIIISFICFILFNFYIKYNSYVINISKDIITIIEDFFIEDYKEYNDYEIIKDENIELKKEINELKETLELNNITTDKKLIHATTINRNVTLWYDLITIDKGSTSFVEPNMGVIYNGNLIGIITEVNNYSSKARLLTNGNKLSVKVNESYGILTEYKNGYYIVDGISNFENVQIGDRVLTTGLSDNIPNGILIGEIVDMQKDNFELTKRLYVKPLVNLNNIKYVTLVGKK